MSTRTQLVGSYVYTRKVHLGIHRSQLLGWVLCWLQCSSIPSFTSLVLQHDCDVSEVSGLGVGYRNDIVQSEFCYCVVSH